jgi:hypothetical protein
MNERIKELALQAGAKVDKGIHPITNIVDGLSMGPDEVEKFAELIVQECVNVVEGGSFLHDQAPTAIFAKECSAAIKRHFGVEQ